MKQAQVPGGLLDKILKTHEGGTLHISHAEAIGILDALSMCGTAGSVEALNELLSSGRTTILGRTVIAAPQEQA